MLYYIYYIYCLVGVLLFSVFLGGLLIIMLGVIINLVNLLV